MGDIMKNITGIAMAIIGVATLAVLVRNAGGTASVIQAATGGFANALGTAMGTGGSQSYYSGY